MNEYQLQNEEIYKNCIVNKVAAGVRKMGIKPVAFLFFDKENYFYDNYSILGIPVYRTSFIYQGNGQEELSFYPIFSDPHFDSTREVTNFRNGYEEF